MDFSINKNSINQQPAFGGLKGGINKKSLMTFDFIAPPYDPASERVILELIPLEKDEKKDLYKSPVLTKSNVLRGTFDKNSRKYELDQNKVRDLLGPAFAYRYVIQKIDRAGNPTGEERKVVDPFKTIPVTTEGSTSSEPEVMNIVDQGRRYYVTPKAGTMYHAFIDSNVILDKAGNAKPYDPELVRNHFNKFGGSIKGLTWLLKETDELAPYRYVMSTPDIGADPTSSHKYWPNNQYRCTSLDDFKEFNRELFYRGKGYVADGAFTSQSLQSPLLHHALKWGETSPFYTMLKLDKNIALGVLPNFSEIEGKKANEHIGIRLVNSPNDKEKYNPQKPTYMQFFDERLSSEKQRSSNELIDAYDTQPSDHYDITSHQDSVQPYYFEIQPDDSRIKEFFSNSNVVYLRDLFKQDPSKSKNHTLDNLLTFEHFKITDKQHSSGASFWDGNVDIVKMNLSNAKDGTKEGMYNAREYLLNAASYWTETIQSDLILNVAKKSDQEMREIARANDVDTSSWKLNTLRSIVYDQTRAAEDYIEAFPLQSLEVSPELDAVFAEPEFLGEFLSEGVRQRLKDLAGDVIEEAIPESIDAIDKSRYKIYVAKTLSNEIIKRFLVYTLNKEALLEDGSIDYDKLGQVTLKSMLGNIEPASVEQERKEIVVKMRNKLLDREIMKAAESIIKNYAKDQLKDITLSDFRYAEAIVLQGKGGLNWRFDAAKDIGDLDSIRSGNTTFDKIWYGTDEDPGVQEFWADFVTRIHKYNPSSYIINEITCLGELVNQDHDLTLYKIDDYMKYDPSSIEAKRYLQSVAVVARNNLDETINNVPKEANVKEYFNDYINDLMASIKYPKNSQKADLARKELAAVFSLNLDGVDDDQIRSLIPDESDDIKQYFNNMVNYQISILEKYNPSLLEVQNAMNKLTMAFRTSGTINYNMQTYEHIIAFNRRVANQILEDTIKTAKNKLNDTSNPTDRGFIQAQIDVLESKTTSVSEKTIAMKALKAKGAGYENWKEHLPYLLEMQFLERTNSTTDSNYGALFNKLSEFAGTNPEQGFGGGDAGNLDRLRNETDDFIRYAQPNTAMLSHVFIDNHDKPKALHALAIDMNLFLSTDVKGVLEDPQNADLRELTENRKDYYNISPRALAVGRVYKQQIDKLYNTGVINEVTKNNLLGSLKNLVNGRKDIHSVPSKKRAESFGNLPFETTIRDMYERAGYDVTDEAIINQMLDFHKSLMARPMALQERLWQVMGAINGVNTLFNGTEFAQTGYESSSKNMFVTNRNLIHHELKNDSRYKDYYTKMQAISGLYKVDDDKATRDEKQVTSALSAMKEGTPTSCEVVSLTSSWKDEFKKKADAINADIDDRIKDINIAIAANKDDTAALALQENKKDLETQKIDIGKFNYFRDQFRGYLWNHKNETPESLISKILDAKAQGNSAYTDFVGATLGIAGDHGNHEALTKDTYLDMLRQFCLAEDSADSVAGWPIYKKDEFGSEVISIITDNGMPKGTTSINFNDYEIKEQYVDAIPLISKDGCPVKEGTELYRKIYDKSKGIYVTDPETYIIKGGAIVAKEASVNGSKPAKKIRLTDTVENFYVPTREEKRRRNIHFNY